LSFAIQYKNHIIITIHSIPADTLIQEVKQPGTIVLDVRTAEETATEHIDGILLIPLNVLPHRIQELSSHTRYLVICKAGG